MSCEVPIYGALTKNGFRSVFAYTRQNRSLGVEVASATGNIPLTVAVQNVTVMAGTAVRNIPFSIRNDGIQSATATTYTIRIYNSQVGVGAYNSNLSPRDTVNINGAVTYTAPTRAATFPIEVCARATTAAPQQCASAILTVTPTQCSDSLDNDSDSFSDRNDIGCYTDPTDLNTYDPTDPTEGDLSSSTLITSMSLTPAVPVVRFGDTATLRYRIESRFTVRCTITGGATSQSFVHRAPLTTGEIVTAPLQSTQNYTMRCIPDPILGNPFPAQTTGAKVEVVPRMQEV
jgi:hypothetical protein